jgi:chemotaxis protein MotB
MVSEFERSTPELARHPQDDPWAAASLPPDNSQHAWLISYIDVLLLLITLLVILLAWQKNTSEKSLIAARATQVVNLPQPSTKREPLVIHNNSPIRPDRLRQEQETLRVQQQPQESSSRPPETTLQAISSPPRMHQMEPSSVTPVQESTTDVDNGSEGQGSATDRDNGSEDKVAAVSEQPTESVSSTVIWDLPDELKEQVEITREAEHIRLEVKDTFLFESGSADLKVQAATVLESLIEMLQRHAGGIAVEGHTDDRPIATARYPSNWELSAARASTVARYLIMHGIAAQRVQAVGYADTRPRSANDSVEGRARNRRVTLVMYPRTEAPAPTTEVSR